MPSPTYFKLTGYAVGGTKTGTLQYQEPNSLEWVDIGQWTATETGAIYIDSARNQIPIPWREPLLDIDDEPLLDIDGTPLYDGIFYAGGGWLFRLLDSAGHPASQQVWFRFPDDGAQLLDVDNTPLLDIDNTPLLDVNSN